MECLGGCHCGNNHVRLRLTKAPEDNSLRACTCSFYRRHNPRMLSDPQGVFEVRADDWSLVERYRFGTRTCDFLICRLCDVFVAAVAEMTEGTRAIVNVNCLDNRGRFRSVIRSTSFRARRSATGCRGAQRTGCRRSCTFSSPLELPAAAGCSSD